MYVRSSSTRASTASKQRSRWKSRGPPSAARRRARSRVDHTGQCVLLAPDLDIDIGIAPQRLAVEPGGLLQCLLDTVEGCRLAHPARQIGDVAIGQETSPTQQ